VASSSILRVEVDPHDGDGPQVAQGHVRLYVGDQELTGVTRIELVAEVNDLWRARVDCMVKPPADLKAVATIRYPTLWQRLKRWANQPLTNTGPS